MEIKWTPSFFDFSSHADSVLLFVLFLLIHNDRRLKTSVNKVVQSKRGGSSCVLSVSTTLSCIIRPAAASCPTQTLSSVAFLLIETDPLQLHFNFWGGMFVRTCTKIFGLLFPDKQTRKRKQNYCHLPTQCSDSVNRWSHSTNLIFRPKENYLVGNMNVRVKNGSSISSHLVETLADLVPLTVQSRSPHYLQMPQELCTHKQEDTSKTEVSTYLKNQIKRIITSNFSEI